MTYAYDEDTKLQSAKQLTRDGHYAAAAGILVEMMQTDPENRSILYGLGYCRYKEGKLHESTSLLSKAVELGHPNAQNVLNKAMTRIDADSPPPPPPPSPPPQEQQPVNIVQQTGPALSTDTMPGGIRCARAILITQGIIMLLILLASVAFVGLAITAIVRLGGELSISSMGPLEMTLAGVAVAMLLVGFLPFIASGGLRRGNRGMAVFVAILSLLGFPIGTAFGIIVLFGVFDKESSQWIMAQRR